MKIAKPGIIGIRVENKDTTERRAPLTPAHVRRLVQDFHIQVHVEPSAQRVYRAEAYTQAGAQITADLSDCNVIFGVKEVPLTSLAPGSRYCIFSHVIKGQSYNMPMLQRLLEGGCTLIDYERIADTAGTRLVHFGRFAGYAGMIDSLWAFGQRLLWEGVQTPFAQLQQANRYAGLAAAKEAVREVGCRIKREGLPAAVRPFVCGITGSGNVSAGAKEIFDLLEPEYLDAAALPELSASGGRADRVYGVRFHREDRIRSKQAGRPVDYAEIAQNPGGYENIFPQYAPHLSVLLNGVYWQAGYPRLLSTADLRRLYQQGEPLKLRVIGDVTNDLRGSIEFNVKATNSEHPLYVFEPETETIVDGWTGRGPVVLAVDKLPTELPVEASASFGEALMPFVPALAAADFTQPFETLPLPAEIKRAIIVYAGRLTPDYTHLQAYLDAA